MEEELTGLGEKGGDWQVQCELVGLRVGGLWLPRELVGLTGPGELNQHSPRAGLC